LLIGHLSSRPNGASLLFSQLLQSILKKPHISVRFINTHRQIRLTSSKLTNLLVALKVTFLILLLLNRVDVISFHASRSALISYTPILRLISKISGRPLVLRLFGGAIEEEYEQLTSFGKWIFRTTILNADLLLVETKNLVSYFQKIGSKNVRWYANSRPIAETLVQTEKTTSCCRKFIFLSRVIEDKGMNVILESLPYLNPEITVDVFGPLDDDTYTAEKINDLGKSLITYQGVLTAEQVTEVLPRYDALILPTFYPGEGYPGVILEAYSHGLPVIATEWRAIPEIVDETSGILIPIKSSIALSEAMNRLFSDSTLYSELRSGALAKREQFSEKVWTEKFLEWCRALATSGR
jgi:glycosyltransferase involved in cell wall biosynthesis